MLDLPVLDAKETIVNNTGKGPSLEHLLSDGERQ